MLLQDYLPDAFLEVADQVLELFRLNFFGFLDASQDLALHLLKDVGGLALELVVTFGFGGHVGKARPD